jgi:uncharacterized protein YfeS
MKISELRDGLGFLAECIDRWGAKGGATELKKLQEALEKYNELTLTDFSKHIADKPFVPKNKKSTSNEGLVEEILSDLNKKEDFDEFSSTLDVLLIDKKRVSNADLFEVANRYVGVKVKGKSRDAAVKAIREARIIAARSTNKISRISGVY